MELIKLDAIKEDLSSLTINGKEYIVNKEKQIEIELEHLELALSHGFDFVKEKVETIKKGKK